MAASGTGIQVAATPLLPKPVLISGKPNFNRMWYATPGSSLSCWQWIGALLSCGSAVSRALSQIWTGFVKLSRIVIKKACLGPIFKHNRAFSSACPTYSYAPLPHRAKPKVEHYARHAHWHHATPSLTEPQHFINIYETLCDLLKNLREFYGRKKREIRQTC